jgi:hypothetical protein
MTAVPDKQAIRAEIEATRRAYHDLLASLSPGDWSRRSGNPDLTIKELMWHMAWSMTWMASSLDAVKTGKSLRLPSFLIEPGRKLAMRWLARRATPESAARKYDEGHDALLAGLEAVRDDEWSLSAMRFGEVRTVMWFIGQPQRHFAEHAADVRAALPAHA